jgi:hypothetical protein
MAGFVLAGFVLAVVVFLSWRGNSDRGMISEAESRYKISKGRYSDNPSVIVLQVRAQTSEIDLRRQLSVHEPELRTLLEQCALSGALEKRETVRLKRREIATLIEIENVSHAVRVRVVPDLSISPRRPEVRKLLERGPGNLGYVH